MNPWPFVIAAYALTGACVLWLSLSSWRAVRRGEKSLDDRRDDA
jgi:hypothetical protein